MHKEIRLTRAELLVLLDAVGATSVVGLAQDVFFPREAATRQVLLSQGMALLEQHGLLQANRRPHPYLLRLARIVAEPSIALLLVRHVQALGPQLFSLFLSEEGMVEQTFPAEDMHRLAEFADLSTLLSRLVSILSLPEHSLARVSIELEQETFFRCAMLVQQYQQDQAQELLQQAGVPLLAAESLVTALRESECRGEVVLLKYAQRDVVDVRDVAVIQGRTAAWSALQKVAGDPLLCLASTDAQGMYELLSQCLGELLQMPVRSS